MTGELDLKLHTPLSAGKALSFEKPWEGTTCFYVSVVHGDGLYRMYYRGHSQATSDEPLSRVAGKAVRLRFVMKDADLYSLRFQ